MRKYRGLTLKTKRWVYGYYCQVGIYHFIIPDDAEMYSYYDGDAIIGHIEVDPETVGQQTPYKDTSRTEIYEGDILNPGRREVRFGEYDTELEQGTGFTTFSHNAQPPWDRQFSFASRQAEGSEIIATIHENPELLK